MKNKIPINISCFFLVFLFLLTPLLYTHAATVINSLTLFIVVFGFYFAGAAMLLPVNKDGLLSNISHAAVSVFIGGLIYSMLVFFSANATTLLILLLVITIVLLFIFRSRTHWSYSLGAVSIVAFLVAILVIVLISSSDINRQFTALQPGSDCYGNDDYFFTSIVASIRHGSIFNAAYEVGSPLNYQVLGFFIPALLANVLGISSHLALWCMSGPFYTLVTLLLCYEVCYYQLKEKVSRSNYGFAALSLLMPVLLAPLHPLYLAKGNIKNFIFNGMGYLVPAGTITYPISIAMFLFCLLLFSAIDWKDNRVSAAKIFFTICLSLIVIGKVPFYACFVLFIGIIVLKRLLFDKEKITAYLPYVGSSVLLSCVLFKVCMGQRTGGVTFFSYGYLAAQFAEWCHKSSTGFINNILIIGIIILTFLLWAGLRLLGLLALARSKNAMLREFSFAAIITLTGITLFVSFLHMQIKDNYGNLLQDSTFNIQQFIRSAFYILTIVASIGILHLFYSGLYKGVYLRSAIIITTAWCCISFSTTVNNAIQTYRIPPCAQLPWYTDNYNRLKAGKYNDGLIAVNPGSQYGIMLAASDYGKYWTAFDRSGFANYNGSIKNEYRWIVFRSLLAHPQEQYLDLMKSDGVNYIISTPADTTELLKASIAFPNLLHKVSDDKWVYELE